MRWSIGPAAAEDEARRDLSCRAYTNKRGVASFVIDANGPQPHEITVWRPLASNGNTPTVLELK